jgi:hypothetical protein
VFFPSGGNGDWFRQDSVAKRMKKKMMDIKYFPGFFIGCRGAMLYGSITGLLLTELGYVVRVEFRLL